MMQMPYPCASPGNNQPPSAPVKVRISLKVDPTSGGHEHGDSTRPRGRIENTQCTSDAECWSGMTDTSGKVVFNFKSPEAAGKHTITATCDGCTNNPQPATVNVKVDGLETIPGSAFYELTESDPDNPGQTKIIGSTGEHGDNHYLTPEAAEVLWRIAVAYQLEKQFKPVNPATGKPRIDPITGKAASPIVLHLNDASLKWGGKFDIHGKWKGDHQEHKRGTVVDVRANNMATAIPARNFVNFKRLAVYYGADPHFESPTIDRQHFHLRLLNRKE